MNNPCKKCGQAKSFAIGKTGKQKHYFCRSETGICEKFKEYAVKHEQLLDSKRKFQKSSEFIQSIDELLGQEWVWMFGKPKHIEVVKSLPLRTILSFIERKQLNKVINKKVEDK